MAPFRPFGRRDATVTRTFMPMSSSVSALPMRPQPITRQWQSLSDASQAFIAAQIAPSAVSHAFSSSSRSSFHRSTAVTPSGISPGAPGPKKYAFVPGDSRSSIPSGGGQFDATFFACVSCSMSAQGTLITVDAPFTSRASQPLLVSSLVR